MRAVCPRWTHSPVDVGVLQVERLASVVTQDEREHRVLHEVVEGAASMLVEVRQVLEVGDLARAPQLGERRDVAVLQQVGQVRGQDVVVDVVAELVRARTQEEFFFCLSGSFDHYSIVVAFLWPAQEFREKNKRK